MEKFLTFLLKIMLSPIYLILIVLPTYFQIKKFKVKKNSMKIKRKNCIFIINPKSGKQLGYVLLNLLADIHESKYVINLLDNNHTEKVK